jgi:ABC-type antimicrobial peptide transport system permease subunit
VNGYLSTLFAALATLLAGIGLYGVLAYSIVRRTREIGIRFAVGAQRREIVGLFARESLILVLVGLSIGGSLAFVSAHALRSLLFGVAPTDPLMLLISIIVLALAALLATSIPLWRAARVDPMVALRWE